MPIYIDQFLSGYINQFTSGNGSGLISRACPLTRMHLFRDFAHSQCTYLLLKTLNFVQ